MSWAKEAWGRVADSEFAFVLTEGSRFTPYRYAKAIIEALDKPLLVEGVEVRLSVSVGLVLTTKQALSADQMMNAAEYATYRAGLKTSRIQLFTDRMAEQQKKPYFNSERYLQCYPRWKYLSKIPASCVWYYGRNLWF